MNNTTLQNYLDECHAQQNDLPGGSVSWLQQHRSEALKLFALHGFPSQHDEAWKYTRVTAIAQKHFPRTTNFSTEKFSLIREKYATYLQHDICLVLIDGLFSADLSKLPSLPGVTLNSLNLTINDNASKLKQYLGASCQQQPTPFVLMNSAWIADGAYLEIADDIQLTHPIHILHISTIDNQAHYPRNFFYLGQRASANLVQHYLYLNDQTYFTNTVTEVILAEHAVLNHVQLQQQSKHALHIDKVYVQQAAHSHYQSHQFSFGGLLARADIQVNLADIAAKAELYGLYMASQRQHLDHHTQIDHWISDGVSREHYKGILDDQSRAVFNGKVLVHPQAQHTDAEQKNANLLLSRHAEIDTKPELEIYANDVKCSHGATVGQLDEEALFYLEARGLDKTIAQGLLIYAFANEMLCKLESKALQQLVQHTLLQHLPAQAELADILYEHV